MRISSEYRDWGRILRTYLVIGLAVGGLWIAAVPLLG